MQLYAACKKRIHKIAADLLGKKMNRRRRGSGDDHEELQDFIDEGFFRIWRDALLRATIHTTEDLCNAFARKLNNRDRQERRAAQTRRGSQEDLKASLDVATNLVPWRPQTTRPDVLAERELMKTACHDHLRQVAPHLLPLFDLQLDKVWKLGAQAEALNLSLAETKAQRHEMTTLLQRFTAPN